ncbi:MAG: pyruvate, phosphate dikinase [Candidatus Diapherotrites archaeon]
MVEKYVYEFSEGSKEDKLLLGGKGANLAEMTKLGLPVPPGFIITTKACIHFLKNNCQYPKGMKEQVLQGIKRLEKKTKRKFGGSPALLVSVRSGAPISMPGMMDTILNLGMNDDVAEQMIKETKNERFVYDLYRRLIQMFGETVKGIDAKKFDSVLEHAKKQRGLRFDSELDAKEMKKIVEKFKGIYKKETHEDFPQDVYVQLFEAINAVFNSWNSKRAITYRKLEGIPDGMGTAVNVQMMVYGNKDNKSATGVLFTRNPSTGEKVLYGEYLVAAQGEDVVAGIRTPNDIKMLAKEMPKVYKQILKLVNKLEKHYRDVQDVEFTVESGKLYVLQTREGKRTAMAAVKIAVDMVKEGLISKEEAIMRIKPEQINQLLHKQIDPEAKLNVVAKGLPASPGAASGKVVFDADVAEAMGRNNEKVILVRPETTPEDIHGVIAAKGVLTSRGGMTSHAAVVARGMGKPCVAGCEALQIDLEKKEARIGALIIREFDIITIDGNTGNVILGEAPTIEPKISGELKTLLSWADSVRKLGVKTNADNPVDSAKAREFGAEGIGLCRTEHMFMAKERVPVVHEMIMATTLEERKKALDKLLPMQRQDFYEMFKIMNNLPVTIRLLDPPLHEFLPSKDALIKEIRMLECEQCKKNVSLAEIKEKALLLEKARMLSEANPMLGHRGVRLGITMPEVYEMQVQAIIEAAIKAIREGYKVKLQIMIPLVGIDKELAIMSELVRKKAEEVCARENVKVNYKIGTMIELPRACVVADQIAKYAEFFSFGTNDLTQTTFGFSRDDAEAKFLPYYISKGILDENPFAVLDTEGVGALMKMAAEKAKKVNKNIELGICGEHGGNPQSIEFCHLIGLDYVSCSPFRVPVARLAAAQAAIKHNNKSTKGVKKKFKDKKKK